MEKARDFLATVTCFRRVEVIKRSQNGYHENVVGGMGQIAADFGRVIFMEDDIITAPGFLRFMNDALGFYQDDERVLSICGCCGPLDWRSATDGFVFDPEPVEDEANLSMRRRFRDNRPRIRRWFRHD